MSPVNEKQDQTFEGCYGEKVAYADLLTFLQDSFANNRAAEESGSEERFATCIWGHSGIGKCVSGDTLIETNKGMMPIHDLFPLNTTGDVETEIAAPRGLHVFSVAGMKPVSHLYYGGVKESIRVVTESGRVLVGSYAHPVRSIRPGLDDAGVPFRRLSDIQLGDFVGISIGADASLPVTDDPDAAMWMWHGGEPLTLPVPARTFRTKDFQTPTHMNEDLAFILGVLVGEGTCTYQNTIRMTQEKSKPLTGRYLDACQKVFGVMPKGSPDKRTEATCNFNLNRSDLRRWLASIGLGYERADDKYVPWSILRARRDDKVAFISGVFESEGSSEKSGMSLSSNSDRLLSELQVMLTSLGVMSYISPKTKASSRLWVTGEDARRLHGMIHFSRAKGGWISARGNPNNKGVPSHVARAVLLRMKESHLRNGGRLTKKLIHSAPLNRLYSRSFLKHGRWSKDMIRRIAGLLDCAGLDCQNELAVVMSYEYERVACIADNGRIPLYDVCVPDGNEFVANGFAVHNTAIVKQHCKKPVEWQGKKYDGYRVIDVPLAQFEEMGDLHGMPSRHVLLFKENGKGPVERWVPEEVVKGYFDDGWKMRHHAGVRTMYAPPDWVPHEPGPTILLLDDWNRASVRIVKGVMQLLQNYGMVSWKLPPGCNIVLTANPDEQEYLVTSLDPAILTRIRSITLKHDAKEWSVWAQGAGIDSRVISWVLQYPEMMIGKERTNPRTIAEAGRSCRHITDMTTKENVRRFQMQASAVLDEETVSSMTVFMQRDVELVVEPQQILDGEEWIPKHIKKLMEGKEKRVDVLGVICDRLFAYVVQPDTEATPEAVKNFQKFLTAKEVPEDMRHNICLRVARVPNGAASEWILHNQVLTNMILDVV